MKMENK